MEEPIGPAQQPIVQQPDIPPQVPEAPKPAEFTPESPKKSFKGILTLVLILILLLTPAGLIYATENGYINLGLDKYYNAIGLEKLWGGLPVDARLAFYQINQKMDKVKSYHFDATADLEGDVSLEDIPSISKQIPQIAQKQTNGGKVLGNSASSATINLGFAGDYETPDKLSGSISVSLNSQELSSLLSPSFSIDVRSLDKKMYFKIPQLSILAGSEANKWLEIDSAQYQADTKDISKWENTLQNALKSSKRLPSEEIKGKNAYHYLLTLDKSKISEPSTGFNVLSDPKVDVWVGKKDHLLYRIKTDATLQSDSPKMLMNVKATIQFSDFDKSFNIEAPPPEEISKEGLLGLLTNVALGGAQNKARDATRKSDLQQIKVALGVYKNDKGKYPICSSTCKTNDPNSILTKALVPKYMTKLPVDPQDPPTWYGYKSDGKTFTLWCLLEDTNDPQGKQDGAYFKYIVTND